MRNDAIHFLYQVRLKDEHLGPVYMERGTPVYWGWFLLFSRSEGHKTKETYPTRPGSPTPGKQGLIANGVTELSSEVDWAAVHDPEQCRQKLSNSA